MLLICQLPFEEVKIIDSLKTSGRTDPIASVILAAGKSERFGAPKVLQHFNGKPFLAGILDTLRKSGIRENYLILGFNAEKMIASLPEIEDLHLVINKNFEDGQFSSLQTGISNCKKKYFGLLICLIDQPHLKSETFRNIVKKVWSNSEKIIIPVFNNRGGHPVYIPESIFPEIVKNSSKKSLREVFSNHQDLILRIAVEDPGILEDIDTPADLNRLENRSAQ